MYMCMCMCMIYIYIYTYGHISGWLKAVWRQSGGASLAVWRETQSGTNLAKPNLAVWRGTQSGSLARHPIWQSAQSGNSDNLKNHDQALQSTIPGQYLPDWVNQTGARLRVPVGSIWQSGARLARLLSTTQIINTHATSPNNPTSDVSHACNKSQLLTYNQTTSQQTF